jgi:hypothetical protein
MDSKLEILLHSLGLNEYGEGRQSRNHFVTDESSPDYEMCQKLVADGLMTKRPGSALSGGSPIFLVTQAGIDFVSLNSPTRPKVTRGKQRYLDFLAADGGMSFREWLGIKPTQRLCTPSTIDMPDFD